MGAGFLTRWLGRLAAVVAAVLILLAVLVGLVRLLLPLVPGYQEEVREVVAAATGLQIEFAGVSAGWPLAGPELVLYNVSVATGAGQSLLEAREVRVGLSLPDVLAGRRLTPGRFVLRGAALRLERIPAGTLVNGVPLEEILPDPGAEPLRRLTLELRDLELVLEDASRLEPRARLLVDQFSMRLTPGGLTANGVLVPRDGLGRSLELAASVPAAWVSGAAPAGATGDWSLSISGMDLDFGRLLRLALDQPPPLKSGRGDLRLRARAAAGLLREARLELDLNDGVLEGLAPAQSRYRRLGLRAGWTRDRDGWLASLEQLAIQRGERGSPVSRGEARYREADGGVLTASAEFLRLDDLWPLVRAVAAVPFRELALPVEVAGDLRDLQAEISFAGAGPVAWSLTAGLRDLGFVMPEPGIALTGITGRLAATQAGGRLDLDARAGLFRQPALFRADIRTTSARGVVGWRATAGGLEFVGENLRLTSADGEARGRLQLTLPREGPALIDLSARITASSAPAVLDYLPLRKFKPTAVNWLDRAVVAGQVPRAELLWQGPIRGFPYRDGGGRFRAEFTVTGGVLDYAPGWPRAEDLTATVVIDRASLSSVENEGALAGVRLRDARVMVPDLQQDARVEVSVAERVALPGVLAFLRQSPIATILGPTLQTVTARGSARAELRLTVPVRQPADYRLDGVFDVERGALGLQGASLGLTDLAGRVRLENTRLWANAATGRFLDEPVTINLRPATEQEAGLSHLARLAGTTPAGKISAAFSLPFRDRLAGDVAWEASVEVPARQEGATLRVTVDSGLAGLSTTLPPPLDKQAGVPRPLRLELGFPERRVIDLAARLDGGVAARLRLQAGERAGWGLERAAFRAGDGLPPLPAEPGLELTGRLPALRFEDWFQGPPGPGTDPGRTGWRRFRLDLDEFRIFGQLLRDVALTADRVEGDWQISLAGPGAEGTVLVPGGSDPPPVQARFERLWLPEGGDESGSGTNGDRSDPRRVPAVDAEVGDLRLGRLQFGRLQATVRSREDGLIVAPLTAEHPAFSLEGDAAWIVTKAGAERQRSELRLTLQSGPIGPALEALGYGPVIEGRRAELKLDLNWPGGPGRDFLKIANGRVTVMMDSGQFLAVDPGTGRLLGLLSIAALPRRLSLDFRDVLDEGLAFDRVRGEFRLEGGNAFTCNLGLEGPVADLGIVGRVGLADRDYDQVAVVRPHVTDVLAIGGAVVAGPVIGGAVLLISQIFRRPLSSLGETYYRVAGSWDAAEVRRVQRSEIDPAPFRDCEQYLADVLKELPELPEPAAGP